MIGINDIKTDARRLGACGMINGLASIREAVNLLMTPQGREFALKTGFPSLEIWRNNMEEISSFADVLLDKGNCSVSNCDFVAVGDSDVNASFSGVGQLYHVVAMHGAKVRVKASNYAVITVTSVSSSVEISNEDNTAFINIEQR